VACSATRFQGTTLPIVSRRAVRILPGVGGKMRRLVRVLK